MLCHKCNVPMKKGIATEQTYVGGMPDFAGDRHSSTFSAGGTGRVIDCMKCPSCGHSVTDPHAIAVGKYQAMINGILDGVKK